MPAVFPSSLRFRIGVAAVGALYLVLTALGLRRAVRLGDTYLARPEYYEQFAALLRAHVPSSAMIVGEDQVMSGVLWSYAPEYRYLGGYDNSFLYLAHPRLFWLWWNMISKGITCDEFACPPDPPDAEAIAQTLGALGSEWFVSFYTRPSFSVLPLLDHAKGRFELVGTTPGTVGRLSLWHLKPAPSS
jgi:hypothetical protein